MSDQPPPVATYASMAAQMSANKPTVPVVWEADLGIGEPGQVLYTMIAISSPDMPCPMSMHLYAIEVVVAKDGEYNATCGAYQDEIEAIYTLRGDDPPDTTEINGREYLLIAYPIG